MQSCRRIEEQSRELARKGRRNTLATSFFLNVIRMRVASPLSLTFLPTDSVRCVLVKLLGWLNGRRWSRLSGKISAYCVVDWPALNFRASQKGSIYVLCFP